GPGQLRRDEHAHQHADDAPDDRHQRELADDGIAVGHGGRGVVGHGNLGRDAPSLLAAEGVGFDGGQSVRRMRSPSASIDSNWPRHTAHPSAPRMISPRATESGMSRNRMSM